MKLSHYKLLALDLILPMSGQSERVAVEESLRKRIPGPGEKMANNYLQFPTGKNASPNPCKILSGKHEKCCHPGSEGEGEENHCWNRRWTRAGD